MNNFLKLLRQLISITHHLPLPLPPLRHPHLQHHSQPCPVELKKKVNWTNLGVISRSTQLHQISRVNYQCLDDRHIFKKTFKGSVFVFCSWPLQIASLWRDIMYGILSTFSLNFSGLSFITNLILHLFLFGLLLPLFSTLVNYHIEFSFSLKEILYTTGKEPISFKVWPHNVHCRSI